MRPVLDASPSLDFSAHFQLLNLRPYKRLEEKRQYSGDVLVLQRSTLSKAPCKRPQHCWMLHDASVCTPCCMLLRVVGSYCPQFESELRANGRNNSQNCWANNVGSCYARVGRGVQTDATTPNIVGPTILRVVASVCTWLKLKEMKRWKVFDHVLILLYHKLCAWLKKKNKLVHASQPITTKLT